jgi:FlaA1/EpsC-like NDP-sugar epimerase
MRSLIKKLLHPTYVKRTVFFVLLDALIIIASLLLAFYVRFEFTVPPVYVEMIQVAFPLFLGVKLVTFVFFKLYRMTWRFVGLRDFWSILLAIFVSEAILLFLVMASATAHMPHFEFLSLKGFPRSIFLLDGLISFCLISGLRLSKRLYLETLGKMGRVRRGARTIIVGAGNTGEMILRDILKQEFPEFNPVVFLDDDPFHQKLYLHGVQVGGGIADMKAAIAELRAEAVIIAIPNLNHKVLKKVYAVAREAGIKTIKIVPRIYDIRQPNINLKGLEEIRIEDLLGRPDVRIDYDEVERFIKGRSVMITGAGGSIGSELVLQVCAFGPSRLTLLDADETEVHTMELRLKREFSHFWKEKKGCHVSFVVGDIRDEGLLQTVFSDNKPELVFHAAACKHVPMMEYNPREAVKVNILGTHNLATASVKHRVKKFIMISTDKAVEPTSVMGASKRVAEYVCKSRNGASTTDFVSVRFGNVLGSRGSVLPLFLDQLKRGGPLTVTHKDMRRYFMTIHEAVLLVLQASVIGNNREVMVLDMGEPVKIVALAEELVRIHGLEPYKDIDIEFIGMRPGEKLFEEVLTAEEGTVASRHEKVFVARDSKAFTAVEIGAMLEEFRRAVSRPESDGGAEVRGLLRKYVRHYED